MNIRSRPGAFVSLLLIVSASLLVSCARQEPAGAPAVGPLDMPTRYPQAQHIVAIGDLHGDLAATRAALRLAGAIDEHDRWAGGRMVIVQTGDQLDRGDDELEILLKKDGPVWSRHYSDDPDEEDCRLLEAALDGLGARRMVVGHTVRDEGISPACGKKVWRIDAGMARHYGGTPAVLELRNGRARVIEAKEPPQ